MNFRVSPEELALIEQKMAQLGTTNREAYLRKMALEDVYKRQVVDGAVYFRENSRMVRPDLNATAEARVKGLVGLRDCVQRLIDMEMDAAAPDADIQAQMAELNRRYDDFSAKYGLDVYKRQDHQQEREQAFLDHKGDCFAIYQVKHTDALRDIRYEGLE